MRRTVVGILVFVALGSSLFAESPKEPTLAHAEADFAVGKLYLHGGQLGTTVAPVVTIDGSPLTIVTFTDTDIVAMLPPGIRPGTYRVVVDTNDHKLVSDALDVALGAVGPQGPKGDAGTVGPAGTPGLVWRGPWSSTTAYARNDAVSFNGASYIATQTNVAGLQPDMTPIAWTLLAGGASLSGIAVGGDLSGTVLAPTITTIGGQTAASVVAAVSAVSAATDAATPNTIMRRDASGNFGGKASGFTGSLAGEVSGTQGATVVASVGGQPASRIAAAVTDVLVSATPAPNLDSLVRRAPGDGSISIGNRLFISPLNNPEYVGSTIGFGFLPDSTVGALLIGGIGSFVDGRTRLAIFSDEVHIFGDEYVGRVVFPDHTVLDSAAGLAALNGATDAATPGSIMRRNAAGAVAVGNALTIAPPPTADPAFEPASVGFANTQNYGNALEIRGFGTMAAHHLVRIWDDLQVMNETRVARLFFADNTMMETAGSVMTAAEKLSLDGATSTATPDSIVRRDASGNFAGRASGFTGSLEGDVSGTQALTVVASIGGQPASSVAAAVADMRTATPDAGANTIMRRDAAGGVAVATMLAIAPPATANPAYMPATLAFGNSGYGDALEIRGYGLTAAHNLVRIWDDLRVMNEAQVHSLRFDDGTSMDSAQSIDAVNTATDAAMANTLMRRDAAGAVAVRSMLAIAPPATANPAYMPATLAFGNSGYGDALEIRGYGLMAAHNLVRIWDDLRVMNEAQVHSLLFDDGTSMSTAAAATLATPASNGLESVQDKAKLDAATAANAPGTLMMRDASGEADLARLGIGGSTADPVDPTKSYALLVRGGAVGMSIYGGNLEFGVGSQVKEANAGKIGYQLFNSDALDIVGAGPQSGDRTIKLWDNVVVAGRLTFGDGTSMSTAPPPASAPSPTVSLRQIALLQWYPQTFGREFPAGAVPQTVVYDGANMLIANPTVNTVTALRASDGASAGTFSFTGSVTGIAYGGPNVWFVVGSNVVRVRASDYQILASYSVGADASGVAFDGADVWVTSRLNGGSVTKIRGADGANLGSFRVGAYPYAVAYDGANVWVGNRDTSNVTKLRASDGAVLGTYNVGETPLALAFDGTNMWIASLDGGSVTKLRASDGATIGTYATAAPTGIAFDGTYMWVANSTSNTVTKLRAADGVTVGQYATGAGPAAVAFDGANVWVTNTSANSVSKF